MLNYFKIFRSLSDSGKEQLLQGSAIRRGDAFTKILESISPPPKVVVEMGTYRGISTAVLASIAEKVYTYDVLYQPATRGVWELFRVDKKINYSIVGIYKPEYTLLEVTRAIRNEISMFVVSNEMIDQGRSREKIKEEIKDLEFDLAVIDANHTEEDAEKDFKLVEHCGRVILDDCSDSFPGVNKFAKRIGAKINSEIGYWEK